eukprot:7169589-Prymnesium_polylepis.1
MQRAEWPAQNAIRRASSAPVVTLPRAYRDRRIKVSLLQRCLSGRRRCLTASMLCTDVPTIGSGWGLHGMVFTAVRGS